MDNPLGDEIKIVKCDMCGKDVTCNAAYPVSQITCFRCHLEKKWRLKEKEAGLDESSYQCVLMVGDDVHTLLPTG